jgi:phosphoribosylanthranilate isomerase
MIPIQDKVRAALLAHEEIEREAGLGSFFDWLAKERQRQVDEHVAAGGTLPMVIHHQADTPEHRAVLAMQGKTHD